MAVEAIDYSSEEEYRQAKEMEEWEERQQWEAHQAEAEQDSHRDDGLDQLTEENV